MKPAHLVSVIIPAYNCERYLCETIQSALAQTYTNLEVIVVDDGSRDNTSEIVKGICRQDRRVRYIYQENRGVSYARNRGIRESKGRYIALLDHDDLWVSTKIEKQMMLFNNNPRLALVFSDTVFFEDGKGELYNIYYSKKPPRGRVFSKLLAENFISCETVVIARWVLDELDEWFPEDMEMSEEYDLFLRIAYRYEIDYIDEPLARYRLHPYNDHRMRDHLLVRDGYKIIERLKKGIPDLEERYRASLHSNIRTILYYECIHFWREGERGRAIESLLRMLKYGFDIRLPLVLPWIIFDYDLYRRIRTSLRKRWGI